MPTRIAGNSMTAQYSSMRELFDSAEQIVGDFDSLLGSALHGSEALRPRQAHAFIREHRHDDRLHALEIALAAGERARVDREERLADARLVALLREKRIRFRPDRRPGERRADELEREREHRALRSADRKQAAALDRLLRVGGRLAVAIERPTLGDLLAPLHRQHDLSAHDR